MDIKLEDDGLTKFLSKDLAKQLPFAQSVVMNQMAFDTMRHLRDNLNQHLNTTRGFLKQSIQVEKATKKELYAEVGFIDRVRFADRLLDGGSRTPFSSKYIAIPLNIQKTKAGGVSKARRPAAILKNKQYFIKEVKGKKYIFKKDRKGIRAMYALRKKTEYRKDPYFPFDDIVTNYLNVNGNYEKRLLKALEKAFKTRK